MSRRKGFTLVELLVAATIISILLVFATVKYRSSAAETRWNHAKVYAGQLANAMQRAKLDYTKLQFSGDMANQTSLSTTDCPYTPWIENADVRTLIPCGYLENGPWQDGYFTYYACEQGGDACPANALACVSVKATARLPDDYKKYKYCVWTDKSQEFYE